MNSRPDPGRPLTVAFIGGGNMARSLVAGLREQGCPGAAIRVTDPDAGALSALRRNYGIHAARHGAEAVADADVIVLAVKPQVMRDVCRELAPAVPGTAVIVSIAAGIRSAQIDPWLGGNRAIVRAMPNTPALLRAGATGLYANDRCDTAARGNAEALLAAVGATVWIDEEALMDAVTAVSGSGPAYFFHMIEAMQAAAVGQGLPANAARTLVLHTALGAARMAIESGEDAATLRTRVTSPGGTTAAALASLESSGFAETIAEAINAATRRGRELSDGMAGDAAR